MTKGLIFFCCACTILLFTIINISIGPIINGKVGAYDPINLTPDWGTLNCRQIQDNYDKAKKNRPIDDKEKKYTWDYNINHCNRKKGMYNMEYTSFIFDIVIGFICGLLGLLHHFELKKEFVSKTGLIGLGCGVIGFVLTLVYVIYNGIVYTNYYNYKKIYKINEKGAYAEKSGDNYKCLFFTKVNDTQALIAKFSDLMQSKYNYDKKMKEIFSNNNNEQYYCNERSPSDCARNGYIEGPKTYIKDGTKYECKYLYYYKFYDYENYDLSMRFLICLILSIFSILCYCVLVFSGFWLLKELPDDTDDILSKSSLSENFNE